MGKIRYMLIKNRVTQKDGNVKNKFILLQRDLVIGIGEIN